MSKICTQEQYNKLRTDMKIQFSETYEVSYTEDEEITIEIIYATDKNAHDTIEKYITENGGKVLTIIYQ